MNETPEAVDASRALVAADLRQIAERHQASARELLPESTWMRLALPLKSDADARGLLAVVACLDSLAEGTAQLQAEIAKARADVEASAAGASVPAWIAEAGKGKKSIDYGRAVGKLSMRASEAVNILDVPAFVHRFPDLCVTPPPPPPPPPRPDKKLVKSYLLKNDQLTLANPDTGELLAELVRKENVHIDPPGHEAVE